MKINVKMYDIDNHNKIKEFLLISNFTPLDTAMYNLKSSLRENKIDINRNMNFKNSQNTLLFIIFIFNITNVLKTFYKNNFFNKKNNSLVLSERIYNYFHSFIFRIVFGTLSSLSCTTVQLNLYKITQAIVFLFQPYITF